MINYIDRSTGQIFAFEEDGSQDEWITPNLEAISDEELGEIRKGETDKRAESLQKIAELEAAVTPRRLRDAITSGDSAFIKGVESKIAALRKTL